MDFYHDQNYQSKYSWDDFPVEVAYRERLYYEVSIATLDQSLQVMAANCCSTPTADHEKEHRFRHELIHEGCVKLLFLIKFKTTQQKNKQQGSSGARNPGVEKFDRPVNLFGCDVCGRKVLLEYLCWIVF